MICQGAVFQEALFKELPVGLPDLAASDGSRVSTKFSVGGGVDSSSCFFPLSFKGAVCLL